MRLSFLRPEIWAAVVVTVTGLLVAGCGTGDTASAGSPSSPGPENSAAPSVSVSSSESPSPVRSRPGRCHTSQLSGRVRLLDAAAGNRYAALILTNTSDDRCRTYGFVGLQLTAAGGRALPTQVIRETRPAPRSVALRPGQSAWTRIHWTVAAGAGEPSTGRCEPVPSRLLVIPPDERTQLSTAWPGGSVCEHGKILLTALRPGVG
jgi:hypothetical protein